MATQKPISTISYNSEAFLKEKLETWLKAHIIQTYMYIKHKGEDGDKDHIHLRIEPNKKLDPMDLTDLLKEYVAGNDKPLGVRPWRPSKEEDWILYALHDKQYLEWKYGGGDKGEKLPYDITDLKAPDNYDLEVSLIRAKASMKHTSSNMAKQMQEGKSPLEIALEGGNVFQVNAIAKMMHDSDYTRVAATLRDVRNAIREAGLFYDESTRTLLTKNGKPFVYSSDMDYAEIDVDYIKEEFKDELPFDIEESPE